ncbi:hypothetical protein, partial [Sphingomonas paucimobilis]
LKNRLGQIDADCANLAHGRLLQWCFNTSTLAHRCRQGASTPTLFDTDTPFSQRTSALAMEDTSLH